MIGDTYSNPDVQEYYGLLQQQSSANNLFNAQQAEKQMQFQRESNAKAMEFSHNEAELNRQWQETMSNTAYQRQIKDMVAAGLNPVLGIKTSGAQVGSVGNPTGTASAGAKAEADTSVNQALSNFVSALVNGATQREVAGINSAAAMHNAELGARATMYASDQNSAAMKYAASMNYAASKYATDWQKEYAENYSPIGIMRDFYNYITGDDTSPSTGKTAANFFKEAFGFTGITLTAKGGRTVRLGTLNDLKNNFWSLTNDSKDILKMFVSGTLYGYKNVDMSFVNRQK